MTSALRLASTIGLAVSLAACAGRPEPVVAGFPLLAFFDGEARSKGSVTTALVFTEAFTARFAGRREAGELVLEERFAFPDRAPLQRWRLREVSPGRYEGTVETELEDGRLAPPAAVEGHGVRNGVVLDYEGHAPGGSDRRLHFTHRMRALGEGRVANHVTVRLLGIPVATSDVVFARLGDGMAQKPAKR